MLVDMNEVRWLSKGDIRNEADLLLRTWSQASGTQIRPPIPVEEIAWGIMYGPFWGTSMAYLLDARLVRKTGLDPGMTEGASAPTS